MLNASLQGEVGLRLIHRNKSDTEIDDPVVEIIDCVQTIRGISAPGRDRTDFKIGRNRHETYAWRRAANAIGHELSARFLEHNG